MALLLMKTRDLTWQDHTLHAEVMLAPTRCGLLQLKHKTLDTKCRMLTNFYERQRAQCIKDFISSSRLIHRRRQKLLQHQFELSSRKSRVRSAISMATTGASSGKNITSVTGRKLSSAPVEKGRKLSSGPWEESLQAEQHPVVDIDTGQGSAKSGTSNDFFVTEFCSDSSPTPSPLVLPSPSLKTLSSRTLGPHSAPTRTSRSKPAGLQAKELTNISPAGYGRESIHPEGSMSRSIASAPSVQRVSSTSQTFRPSLFMTSQPGDNNYAQTVKFTEADRAHVSNESDTKSVQNLKLETRVRIFLEDIKTFTAACRQGRQERTNHTVGVERDWDYVAKRRDDHHNTNQAVLLSAFDQLCKVQTPEQLARAMKLVCRLKADVKDTRKH